MLPYLLWTRDALTKTVSPLQQTTQPVPPAAARPPAGLQRARRPPAEVALLDFQPADCRSPASSTYYSTTNLSSAGMAWHAAASVAKLQAAARARSWRLAGGHTAVLVLASIPATFMGGVGRALNRVTPIRWVVPQLQRGSILAVTVVCPVSMPLRSKQSSRKRLRLMWTTRSAENLCLYSVPSPNMVVRLSPPASGKTTCSLFWGTL
jgi:hypothetical protein